MWEREGLKPESSMGIVTLALLFMCSLFNNAVCITQSVMSDCQVCGRRQSWPDLRYYDVIILWGLRNTTINLSV